MRAHVFWWSVGLIHGLSWIFLALASFVVPRSWQDNPPDARSARRRELWHRWSFGDNTERLAFRRRMLDNNAFYWLAGRARLKPLHVWAALTVLACLWTWGALENGSNWTDWPVYAGTAVILNTVLKLWVTSEAGRRLGEDRKLGALELLLSTQLDVKDILRGQFLALRRQFLWPLLAVVVVEGVFVIAALLGGSSNADDAPFFLAWGLAFVVMLILDLFALSAVAMWVSLTARNPNRTTGITVRRVLVLPFAVCCAFLLFASFFASGAPAASPDWKFVLASWFVPGLLADVFFGLGAWRRLRTELREAAVQRYTPSASFFRRWFGRRHHSVPESH